jgi:hypothetical protein
MSWLSPARALRADHRAYAYSSRVLPVGWLVLAVVLAVLLTMWVTFTITRLDRLHARVDAAQAALDAQLVRRAAALGHVVDAAALPAADRARIDRIARTALDPGVRPDERQAVENAVGRAVGELATVIDPLAPESPVAQRDEAAALAAELREAATRVLIARRFYNDAVRDTRTLRERRMPRALHLAGHRSMPEFFDIDDTLPPAPVPTASDATLVAAPPPRPEYPEEDSP